MSPGSILTESAKIWKKDTAMAPSFLSSTNHLQEGDVVTDEHTICYRAGKTAPRYRRLRLRCHRIVPLSGHPSH